MPELMVVGSIVNEATPSGEGGHVYVESTGYGNSAGVDNRLLFRSVPYAPAGPDGRVVGRGCSVLIGFDAACRVRLTPLLDLNTLLTERAVTKAFVAPGRYVQRPIDCTFARVLTYFAIQVEVLERAGPVDVSNLTLRGRVKVSGSRLAAQGAE